MAETSSPQPRRWRIPIAAALSGAALLLVALLAGALFATLAGGRDATSKLLRERNAIDLDRMVERIQLHLEPVRAQAQHVAAEIGAGRVDPSDQTRMGQLLQASIAALPQVAATTFISDDLMALRVERRRRRLVTRVEDSAGDGRVRAEMDRLAREVAGAGAPAAMWGGLIWVDELAQPLVNLRVPVTRAGVLLGMVATLVTVSEFSALLAGHDEGWREQSFVLVDENLVLAHRSLAAGRVRLSPAQPLPRVDEVGDRVLAAIWTGRVKDAGFGTYLVDGSTHVSDVGGERFVYTYRRIEGYADKPWLVGRYAPLEAYAEDLSALRRAGGVAGLLLVGAVIATVLLGRMIARPLRRLALQAAEVQRLNLAEPAIDGSCFQELDEAFRAFAAMRQGLRWFALYVPRRLVNRLIEEGDEATHTRQRHSTILFTDIAGFTRQCEQLSAAEVAVFLNAHFALLAGAIEAEDGMIDKFMGDGLMAAWGTLKKRPDHADAAVRAALAIAAAVRADNAERRAAGLTPVRLRLGLHTGTVVVGNIGAPGRLNYTIVGDPVNVADRLQDFARSCMAEGEEVVVLASADTVSALSTRPPGARPLGAHPLRGRDEAMEVWRLA
ncbi:MAG: hypothetical protein OHK0024_27750 [Thalassobaculales bacterium]